MKKIYFTPITKPISIPSEELMIPSLYGPSGQEVTPLNPSIGTLGAPERIAKMYI